MCRSVVRWGIPVLLAMCWAVVPAVAAQTASEHIALGDAAYAERLAPAALDHYNQALAVEATNYDALCKASRVEVDLAEAAPKGARQDSLLASAQRHAEAAIAVNARGADGHFSLARAVGRKALSVGTMDRIHYAKVIHAQALEALAADSVHPGALHVLGMWNAEIMRVNGLARTIAKTFLGAQVFGLASWDEAQRLLEQAVRIDPDRIVHHLDLGTIYMDRGARDKAREQFEWIAKAPVREYNDPLYQRLAAERLRKL